MPKMTLSETLTFNGQRYGPGQDIELPNDPALLERAAYFEEMAKTRNREALSAGLQMLPAGHPYRQMFPTISTQPPTFEGEATAPSSAAFQAAGTINTNSLLPDGHTVSGVGSPNSDAFERGGQTIQQFSPSGQHLDQALSTLVAPSAAPGEARGSQDVAEVNGVRMAPSLVPAPIAPPEGGSDSGSGSGGDNDGDKAANRPKSK